MLNCSIVPYVVWLFVNVFSLLLDVVLVATGKKTISEYAVEFPSVYWIVLSFQQLGSILLSVHFNLMK